MKNFILAAAIALSAMPALANDEAVTYPFEGSFDAMSVIQVKCYLAQLPMWDQMSNCSKKQIYSFFALPPYHAK